MQPKKETTTKYKMQKFTLMQKSNVIFFCKKTTQGYRYLLIINIAITCFLYDRIDSQKLKFEESISSNHPKRNQHLDEELKS